MRKLMVAGALAISSLTGGLALAAEGGLALKHLHWHFQGPFGTYDRAAAQRGFLVYKDVCAQCHGLSLVAYRDLRDLGFTENAVKGFAAEVQIPDIGDDGQPIERPGRPSDRFKKPFPNEAAARAVHGAFPPDLSLIVKSRPGGPDFTYSLITGYADPDKLDAAQKKALNLPADFKLADGMHFNLYFPGHQIKMPPPLNVDDKVAYADGTKATIDQMAKDVTEFLAWASEPKLEDRKRTGVRVLIFLVVLAGFMLAIQRKVWADAH
jgi:ubiquinol-cytochrome c reductase cytochrome c1 subunit